MSRARTALGPLLLRAASNPSPAMGFLHPPATFAFAPPPGLGAPTQLRENRDFTHLIKLLKDGGEMGHASSIMRQLNTHQQQEATKALSFERHTIPSPNGDITLCLIGCKLPVPAKDLFRLFGEQGSPEWLRFSVYPKERVIAIGDGATLEHYDIWKRLKQEEGCEKMDILTSTRGYVGYPDGEVRPDKPHVRTENKSLEEHYDDRHARLLRDNVKPHLQLLADAGLEHAEFTAHPAHWRWNCETMSLQDAYKKHRVTPPATEQKPETWQEQVSTPSAPGTLGK